MGNGRKGFTILELMVVLIITAIVTSITVRSIRAVQASYASRAARDVFAGLVSQARSQAIETGTLTLVEVSAARDSVLVTNFGGDVLAVVRFHDELEVDLRMTTPTLTLCMSPRGYGCPGWTSFSSVRTIAFQSQAEVDSLRLYPYGQVRY